MPLRHSSACCARPCVAILRILLSLFLIYPNFSKSQIDLPGAPTVILPTKEKENVTIAIVGAGLAGLAAASRLYAYGFRNIKVLEASNRIGGRMWTVHGG